MIRLAPNILKHHVYHKVLTDLGPLHVLVLMDMTMSADNFRGNLGAFDPTTLHHITPNPEVVISDLLQIGALHMDEDDMVVTHWQDYLPGDQAIMHRSSSSRRNTSSRWSNEKPVRPVEKVVRQRPELVPGAITPQAIIDAYHKHMPGNPGVRVISEGTKSKLRARIKEDRDRLQIEWWDQYFAYAATRDWLTGRTVGRQGSSFMASFGWLIGPQNMEKVINGEYKNDGD